MSPQAANASAQSCSGKPEATASSSILRPRSLALVARMSIMRFRYTRPSLIISTVEKPLSMSFCAVPAFRRVEPVIASGPVSATSTTSLTADSSGWGFEVISTVNARAARAARSAPPTYGVLPGGGQPDDQIGGRDHRRRIGPVPLAVLGVFHGLDQRGRAAGLVRDDDVAEPERR